MLIGCTPPPEFAHLRQSGASNTEPYYGGKPKSPAQLEADRDLLAAVDRSGVPRARP
jgi:hypothetical protein